MIFENIEVTHYVNPHMFWFKNPDRNRELLKNLEKDLVNFVQKHRNDKKVPAKQYDSVVAFRTNDEKWVRAEVDFVDAEKSEAILWALDYGRPFACSFDSIIPLFDSDIRDFVTGAIIEGGISGIIPAEKVQKL